MHKMVAAIHAYPQIENAAMVISSLSALCFGLSLKKQIHIPLIAGGPREKEIMWYKLIG